MVCIIDDRDDVWNAASNLILVKKYSFFPGEFEFRTICRGVTAFCFSNVFGCKYHYITVTNCSFRILT